MTTNKPIGISVCITRANDELDANSQCKQSLAYRKILEKHPSKDWTRRHVRTTKHPQSGLWMVDFEVCRLEAPVK